MLNSLLFNFFTMEASTNFEKHFLKETNYDLDDLVIAKIRPKKQKIFSKGSILSSKHL